MGEDRPLRLVFMGTPDLAAEVFRHVLAWTADGSRATVVAAYSQPDRPAGRGLAVKAPPVKAVALEHGIPVHQPLNFKADAEVEALRALSPDYLLVAAYGLILPQRVLDIPRKVALNVHTSLLPRYRGAAPIQRAVMNGDARTGVSIMAMDAGLDTGPVILQRAAPIGPSDTAGTMHDALAKLGGALLVEALEGLEAGTLSPHPQDSGGATYAAKLEKADGAVDFSRGLLAVDALIRGVTPRPGAFAVLEREGEKPVRTVLASGSPLPGDVPAGSHPGDILGLSGGKLAVCCADGLYGAISLKPAGKSEMDAAAFANGYLRGKKGRFAPVS